MVENDDDDNDEDVTGVSFSEWVGLTLIHLGSGMTCLCVYMHIQQIHVHCMYEQSLISEKRSSTIVFCIIYQVSPGPIIQLLHVVIKEYM